MKRYTFLTVLLLCNLTFSQNVSEIDVRDYQSILTIVESQNDNISLNSVIEVNGIPHLIDTYGYIDYLTAENHKERCFFLHFGGIIVISESKYDKLLKIPDSSKVEIAICLQSPVVSEWGGYRDKVIIKGYFNSSQLVTTRSKLTPCFHFIITSLGKELFKIRFESWEIQTCYYSISSRTMTSRQRKRLDRKECRLYKRVHRLDFDRELW